MLKNKLRVYKNGYVYIRREQPGHPELLGHRGDHVRGGVGRHTDEDQDPRRAVAHDHRHRQDAAVLRVPQVGPLPPRAPPPRAPPRAPPPRARPPPRAPSSRAVRQVHQRQVLHQKLAGGAPPRRGRRAARAPRPVPRALGRLAPHVRVRVRFLGGVVLQTITP